VTDGKETEAKGLQLARDIAQVWILFEQAVLSVQISLLPCHVPLITELLAGNYLYFAWLHLSTLQKSDMYTVRHPDVC
jgi:hypothetical protein